MLGIRCNLCATHRARKVTTDTNIPKYVLHGNDANRWRARIANALAPFAHSATG